ncbi:heme biosynthesis HemY N-terminal domain-containing protein [Roseomonas marmotae]|uniref:Heme biosynthesis protein HemY n=1 Tax=Roseomonas marmotae TaxID=2768161 RepID=A0ABS3KG12_9PROT|nr:heme biosynthesis HemY N-terminal domain-containing protein [Roseomonas marmotae]MBO1076362.1 heme biosynthesis protein HemY [Roseomonas marmotae]QTI80593.1 heme biosynthesis protein HemY [Roseomonas marmotae]
MRRALWLLLLCLVTVGVAWFLMRMGGTVEVRVGDTFIGVNLPVVLLILAVLFLVLHGLLSGWRALRRLPARMRAKREARDREKGEAALTRALVALAAGTADTARLEVRRARQLLGDKPQVLLLSAEAERLNGSEEGATEAFQALAAREDARFLGLRGLLRQAIQRQDWPAAQQLAREAEAAQPGAAWLREERAALALRTRDWREALALAAPKAPKAQLAMAAARQEQDPAQAAELERQAFQADPGFAPAAVAYAARLEAAGSHRKARGVLEQAWAAMPHPDIAAAYLDRESDPLERVKLAEALVHANRNHPESRLLLARTALAASLTGRARQELEALVQEGTADTRAYLALVELEQVEHGESAVARAAEARWLRAATAAPSEPRWRCGHCGKLHAQWVPVCDACGTAGEVAWQPGPAQILPRA